MRFEAKRVARQSAFACLAAVLLGACAFAAERDVVSRAAQTKRGVLVLQVGSDWCVSGENVRKAFESREFTKAVEGKYVLAVYDEMDSPTEAVKVKNELVKDILIRTKRFPALTCYAPGRPPRVFAQIENIPGNVTPRGTSRPKSSRAPSRAWRQGRTARRRASKRRRLRTAKPPPISTERDSTSLRR